MKTRNLLCSFGLALLLAACNPPGYYSSFTSRSSFELAPMNEMLNESVDSVLYLTNEFCGSYDCAVVFAPASINRETNKAAKPGFIISLQKDKTLEEGYAGKPFAAFSKVGGSEAYAYAVYADVPGSTPEHTVAFTAQTAGMANLEYCYVNNTNEVVNLVTYGAEGIEPFGPGDYLKVTMTIHSAGATTTQKEIMLADYTGSSLELIKEWTKVELSASFTYMDISVTSNRTDIPRNFCLDELVAHVEIGEKWK